MNVVFVGIQGSGKGTQARLAVERFGYGFFEAGTKLRAFAELDHPMAPRVKDMLARGELVPDDVMGTILEHYRDHHEYGRLVFDGIPRTPGQKALFDRVIKDYFIVFLDLNEEEAVKRLGNRRVDPATGESFPPDFKGDVNPKTGNALVRRADDTPEAVARRVKNFYANTLPLLAQWAADGRKVYTVDASLSIESVFAQVRTVFSAYEGTLQRA